MPFGWFKKPPEPPPAPKPPRQLRYPEPEIIIQQIEAYWDTQDEIKPFNQYRNPSTTIHLEVQLNAAIRERDPFHAKGLTREERDTMWDDYNKGIIDYWASICTEIRDRKREELRYRQELQRQQFIRERDEQRKAERQQEREQREAQRQQEREEREEQRRLEKERLELQRKREQEERDPTPVLQPPSTDTDIPYSLRPLHVCIPGGTQRGKTNLMRQLVLRDIRNGLGVGVLDPKGTLIQGICNELSDRDLARTIYLDLKTPIPIDFMSFNTPEEKEALVGELKYVVLKGDDSLKRAEPILTDLIYSLLACKTVTFLDIHKFFTNRIRQKEILSQLEISDPELWQRWKSDFPTPKEYQPLTNRMNDFVRNPSLRAIFDTPNPALNINTIMDTSQNLLVNLAGIGDTRKIFGSLLVSKFQQAAFRRADLHKSQIVPFYLYVDEFEYFQTSSFAEIFSVAGGLGLPLTIGNQYTDQLDPSVLSSVIGNAGSYIFFQLSQKDLHLFTHKIKPYDVRHLVSLDRFQACFKVGSAPPIWKWTAPPPHEDSGRIHRRIELLKKQTLERYGTKQHSSPSPSQTPPNRHTERNGYPTTSKAEDIEPDQTAPHSRPPQG